MGLGGKVHHGIGLEAREDGRDCLAIGDIGLDELITRAVGHGGKRLEVAGIGQLVQIEHFVLGMAQQMANERRANEAGSAGDQESHFPCPYYFGWRIACW
ncbi:hypothetical protein D3C72_2040170 [compost metagenome]